MLDSRRLAALRARLDLAPEVAAAVAAGLPVVALESTLISHGLPYPQNLEVASSSEAAVREAGAVPATIAIRDGRILVGLDEATLGMLATADDVRKVARPTLAGALTAGGWGATTVSATMVAAHAAGIRVFATGGIGGVHPGAFEPSAGPDNRVRPPSLDVSVDLEELARTPVVVVCAGPKAILDVPATLEVLETRGVPVVVIGTDELPGFFSRRFGHPGTPVRPRRGRRRGARDGPPRPARRRRPGLRPGPGGARAAPSRGRRGDRPGDRRGGGRRDPRPGPHAVGPPAGRRPD